MVIYPGVISRKLGSTLIKNDIDVDKGMDLINKALDLSPERAMDWIEQGHEIHAPQIICITATVGYLTICYKSLKNKTI